MSGTYTLTQVYRYDVSYYAGGKTEGLRYQAMVGIRDENNKLIAATYFHNDGEVESPAVSKTESGMVIMHLPLSAFSRIVDLLRNEKPVYLRFRDGSPPVAAIDTSSEPVGEGNE